jgi:hypothetical protein
MEISRSGSQPSRKGPENFFTGSVRIDPLFEPKKNTRTQGALVTFEPGAHTPWHYPFFRSNFDRRFWPRLGSELGSSHRGDSPWGCNLVCT